MAIAIEHQTAADAEGLFLALQDERIYEFLDEVPPDSSDAVRAVIERRLKGAPRSSGETWLNWTVFEDDVVVGYTQATLGQAGTASLAYVLSPNVWGRSVAYTACVLTIAELKATGSITALTADTKIKNVRSQALLERLGFNRNYADEHDVFYKRILA
ncbi:RimJ/RimL family protein N-acetyltransferase [Labrenzia sp. EL_13]|nr:RimJ/RimL family protein N-acetyltransferase [Labrenzia sp. EL_13]